MRLVVGRLEQDGKYDFNGSHPPGMDFFSDRTSEVESIADSVTRTRPEWETRS